MFIKKRIIELKKMVEEVIPDMMVATMVHKNLNEAYLFMVVSYFFNKSQKNPIKKKVK